MAESNKRTREWIKDLRNTEVSLTTTERRLLPVLDRNDDLSMEIHQESYNWILSLLTARQGRKLSEVFRTQLSGLVKVCVETALQPSFYYALDEINQFRMTEGLFRPSMRSQSYTPFIKESIWLLWAYARLRYYGAALSEVLTGNVASKICQDARDPGFRYSGILAALIDLGDQKTIQAVEEVLLGEQNTQMITHELIQGIVKSKSMYLYQRLGDFLLAARLQEGARQAVCETMDAGRPEAFLYLLQVIQKHHLIRYSSVKRAVSTWIGICEPKSIERISDKLIISMSQCLNDEQFCEEQLKTEDSVAICCALWAKGFYDVHEAAEAVKRLSDQGTKNQLIIASYYIGTFQNRTLQQKTAKKIWFDYPGDLELAACYLPYLLGDVLDVMGSLLDYRNSGCYRYGYSMSYDKGRAPKMITPEKLSLTREEALRSYEMLKEILPQLEKKRIDYHPCMIPSWYRVTLGVPEVSAAMCLLAWALQEEELLDDAALRILSMQGGRHLAARILLYRPKSKIRRELLLELLRNPERCTREVAGRLLDLLELTAEEYQKIETQVRYKKSQPLALKLLKKQEAEAMKDCVSRLLKEKPEECHLGALELSRYMKEKMPGPYQKVIPLLKAYEHPTEKEQIFLRELVGGSQEVEEILKTPGYGLYRPNVKPVIPKLTIDKGQARQLFQYDENVCIRVREQLSLLIDAHKEDEYRDMHGEERALGVEFSWYRSNTADMDFPFMDLWEEFYLKEIKDPRLLVEVYLYQACLGRQKEYQKRRVLYQNVFGRVPFEKLMQESRYDGQMESVISVLLQKYVPGTLKGHWALAGLSGLLQVMGEPSKGNLPRTCTDLPLFRELCRWLAFAWEENWESAFVLKYRVGGDMLACIQAYRKGMWTKDMLYQAIFQNWQMEHLVQALSAARSWTSHRGRGIDCRDMWLFFGRDYWSVQKGFDPRKEEKEALEVACELYEEVIPMILKVELRRGEEETPFSKCAVHILAVYGITYLIQILTALGREPFKRGYGMYGTDRQTVLCQLLKVSRPAEEETGEDLKRAVKSTSITKKRLVEAAMYAPQWIPVIAGCLNITGLQSGCYYFMAHTSEWITDQMMAVVAKYTPLSRDELSSGAFDIQWFWEAYKSLGEKDFKLLYDAAKYSAVSSAHARARKYANAALGTVTQEALIQEIDKKRNKDLLMSLGLLPLSEDKEVKETQLLERYQYIMRFQKESRQFGAQRRASEKRAADMALQNLSIHAGFTDVMRLILRMESRLTEEYQAYFSWQDVEEIRVRVQVDETGKSAVLCERDGKILKSVPASYKKHETVMTCQKICKELKEQYRRSKKMLEQAMEERTAFEVWELKKLLQHPVIRPMAEKLIYRITDDRGLMGFWEEEGLRDLKGEITPLAGEEEVWIAHPLDFYRNGHWQDYQRELFAGKIRQPFKQVFRELYVKLSEELEKEESRLFAGYQIQPNKTVATLRERRWVADYEDGLQKVYYKEDVVAVIYALADWFSPADIEAPTLEGVAFYDRKTYRPLKIKEVLDLVYSEVMRDVDLVVSTAYVGGVDPVSSHSTMEMRKVIVEGNLKLFGIGNVRLEGNHAWIEGKLGQYTVHLGSGVVHQVGNAMLHIVPVHSQYRGKVFLPFADEDPKMAEVMTKIWMLAEDTKIKDPGILGQIR